MIPKEFLIKWEKDKVKMKKVTTKMIPMVELFHKGYRFDWKGHFECHGIKPPICFIELDFCAN